MKFVVKQIVRCVHGGDDDSTQQAKRAHHSERVSEWVEDETKKSNKED